MIKIYKTIKGLHKQCSNQLTAQHIINGNMNHINHGWIKCKLTENEMEKFYTDIRDIIGGRKQIAIRRALRKNPNHWAFKRIIYDKYGWNYYAGQDYTFELNLLRKYLYNL